MGHFSKLVQAIEALDTLFAANPPPKPPPQPTVLGTIIIVVALFVALVVGWWNWREANEEISSESPEEILASFEEAHEAGELDDEEMKRLRAKLLMDAMPPLKKRSEGGKVSD